MLRPDLSSEHSALCRDRFARSSLGPHLLVLGPELEMAASSGRGVPVGSNVPTGLRQRTGKGVAAVPTLGPRLGRELDEGRASATARPSKTIDAASA